MLRHEIVSLTYKIDIPLDKFILLERADDEHDDMTPYAQLKKVEGVWDIEYNGHFGNHIWITVAKENDRWEFIKTLEKILASLK
jgi:hypothetical protein